MVRCFLYRKVGPEFRDQIFTWEDSRFKILLSVLIRCTEDRELKRVKELTISRAIFRPDNADAAAICCEARTAVNCFLYGKRNELENLGPLAAEIYKELENKLRRKDCNYL